MYVRRQACSAGKMDLRRRVETGWRKATRRCRLQARRRWRSAARTRGRGVASPSPAVAPGKTAAMTTTTERVVIRRGGGRTTTGTPPNKSGSWKRENFLHFCCVNISVRCFLSPGPRVKGVLHQAHGSDRARPRKDELAWEGDFCLAIPSKYYSGVRVSLPNSVFGLTLQNGIWPRSGGDTSVPVVPQWSDMKIFFKMEFCSESIEWAGYSKSPHIRMRGSGSRSVSSSASLHARSSSGFRTDELRSRLITSAQS